MLSLKSLGLPATALLLAACASASTPEYSVDHPANPAAAAAPGTAEPSAIAAYRSLQPAPGSTEKAPDSQENKTKEDPHAGHR